MTFNDLEAATEQQSRLTKRLQVKLFWLWDIEEHKQEDIKTNGDCCFNHIIGLPQKDSVDELLYDYEKIIFDSLILPNGIIHTNIITHIFKTANWPVCITLI